MKSNNITSILNRIVELKNQFSDRKLTAEDYIDEDTGLIGIRIVDGYNTVEVVEPIFTIDACGKVVERFSPYSIIEDIEVVLN